ncbi:hypothetical protein FY152_02570 [Agrobacterium tumefaciens]|nr:hypothetical protein FY152_02570 [Agrobacterium tumefaciens]
MTEVEASGDQSSLRAYTAFPNLPLLQNPLPPNAAAVKHRSVQPVSRKEASHGYFLLLAQPPALPPFCPADAFAGLTGTPTLWFAQKAAQKAACLRLRIFHN